MVRVMTAHIDLNSPLIAAWLLDDADKAKATAHSAAVALSPQPILDQTSRNSSVSYRLIELARRSECSPPLRDDGRID